MTILEYYPEIYDSFAEYVTRQEMCEICGICHSTAYKAEKRGEVVYEKVMTGRVHTHKIKLTDLLAYKYKREYGYRQDDEYIAYLRRFYVRKLKDFTDVLSAMDVSQITGFEADSVQRWIGKGYLKAFTKGRGRGFRIPKESLMDFLISPVYNAIQDKSKRQIATVEEFSAWYGGEGRGREVMTPDYEKLLDGYPEFISREQMRLICHISKKTARLLLQTGLVPCISSDRKTHTYKIAKSDIIEYLHQRDTAPERYALPEGSYMDNRREQPTMEVDYDSAVSVDFSLFEDAPDMLSVQQAAALAGVTVDTISGWARKKHLKAFIKNGAYHVPKLALMEYLQSLRHKRNTIRQRQNLAARALRENEATLTDDTEGVGGELPKGRRTSIAQTTKIKSPEDKHTLVVGIAENEPPEDNAAPVAMPSVDYDYTAPAGFSTFEESPDLLTVQQAAKLANTSPDVMNAWIGDKRLRLFTQRQKYYIPKLALLEHLQSFSAQGS